MTQIRTYMMYRPEWEDVAYPKGILTCSCGASLFTQAEVREHWQAGHFDKVINVGDPDYVEPLFTVRRMEGG